MVIKSAKDLVVCSVLTCLSVAVLIICSELTAHSILGAALLGGLLIVTAIRVWIFYGRVLIMDKTGCTIRFAWYKKKYRWEELQTKRVENYTDCLHFKYISYVKGAFFSPYTVHKPRWMPPILYGFFRNPFSFFFVYFQSKERDKESIAKIYEIKEDIFRERMKEWNVELEELILPDDYSPYV